jgi:hypothetical protein
MNPKIAQSILVIIAIICLFILAIILGFDSMGLMTIDRSNALNVEINSNIYSTKSSYGILGENNTFNFHISNYSNKTQNAMILFHTEEYEIFGTNLSINGGTVVRATISQQLSYQGPWTVQVFSEKGEIIKTYSFIVEPNKAEADVKINQYDDIQYSKNMSLWGLIVSIVLGAVAILISALALFYSRKKRKSDE